MVLCIIIIIILKLILTTTLELDNYLLYKALNYATKRKLYKIHKMLVLLSFSLSSVSPNLFSFFCWSNPSPRSNQIILKKVNKKWI